MSRISSLHAKWLACQPLPEQNSTALWQWIRMRFNHLSNRFEGNTLSYSETQLLLIYGRAAGDHELREYEEMKAHDVAFDHVRNLAAAERPIGETDIRDLNRICLKEPFYKMAQTPDGEPTRKRIVPGEYKTQPNHVLTTTGEVFSFAAPEETPALMAELAEWMRQWLGKGTEDTRDTLVSFLAELHQRFIRIHPFDDGNGRVARLLMNYILVRLDFLPMVLDDRDRYIAAIQFADTGDIGRLEELFADCIAAMLEKGIYARDRLVALNEGAARAPAPAPPGV